MFKYITGPVLLMKCTTFLYFPCSAPNDKKSFCSIEGEWNGVMYAKWATGVSPRLIIYIYIIYYIIVLNEDSVLQ